MRNTIRVNLNPARILGVGLLISAFAFPADNAHGAQIDSFDRTLPSGGTFITGRGVPEMLALLATNPVVTVKGNVVDPLRAVVSAMRDAVRPCGGGILSLGEGRSAFIYSLLTDRQHNANPVQDPNFPITPALPSLSPAGYLKRYDIRFSTPTRPGEDMSCGLEAVAVDFSYPRHTAEGLITDARRPSTGTVAGLDRYDASIIPWIKQFPLNFRSQSFQELDLRDKNGLRQRFPLIFSSFGLSSLIFIELEPELETIIDKTLDHLLPGGMLIMAPVRCSQKDHATVPGSIERYYAHLRKLVKSGVVADFNVLDKSSCYSAKIPMPASILIVIKSSSAPEGAELPSRPVPDL